MGPEGVLLEREGHSMKRGRENPPGLFIWQHLDGLFINGSCVCDSIDLCCPFDVNIVHLKTVNEEDVGSPSKLHDTLNQHLYKNDSTDLNTSWLTDTAIIYTNTCM